MTAETAESGGSPEEEKISEISTQPTEEMSTLPESFGEVAPAQPQAGRRRTQLKIVRESVESLSREVGSLRKSSEVNAKKMETHLKLLRKELGAHTRSKELGEHTKRHRADTERLEKEMASLRKDMASFRSEMSKEYTKSRKQSEAAFAKFATKVRAAKPKKLKIRVPKKKKG